MPVSDSVVKSEVGQVAPVNMCVLVSFRGKDYPGLVDAALPRLFVKVGFGVCWVLEEPQDAVRDPLEDVHPAREGAWVNLVQLVEICEYELVFGKAELFASRSTWFEHITTTLLVVVREV